jgi:hypothetical protein
MPNRLRASSLANAHAVKDPEGAAQVRDDIELGPPNPWKRSNEEPDAEKNYADDQNVEAHLLE